MIARSADLTRPRKAPHQQLVGAVIEPVQLDRPRRQRRTVKRNTSSHRTQRRIPQHGLADARQPPPLHQQPRFELGAGAGIEPLQQLAANERRLRLARNQRQHVHRSPRRQPQLQRIPAQRAGNPKSTTQLRQRPAQRPARIIGITEDQPRQPRARHRPLRQDHVRQHGPRLMTTRRRDNHSVALNLRRSQQADHVRRHDTTIVNRPALRSPETTLNVEHPQGHGGPGSAVHTCRSEPLAAARSWRGARSAKTSGRLRRPSAHARTGRATVVSADADALGFRL